MPPPIRGGASLAENSSVFRLVAAFSALLSGDWGRGYSVSVALGMLYRLGKAYEAMGGIPPEFMFGAPYAPK